MMHRPKWRACAGRDVVLQLSKSHSAAGRSRTSPPLERMTPARVALLDGSGRKALPEMPWADLELFTTDFRDGALDHVGRHHAAPEEPRIRPARGGRADRRRNARRLRHLVWSACGRPGVGATADAYFPSRRSARSKKKCAEACRTARRVDSTRRVTSQVKCRCSGCSDSHPDSASSILRSGPSLPRRDRWLRGAGVSLRGTNEPLLGMPFPAGEWEARSTEWLVRSSERGTRSSVGRA